MNRNKKICVVGAGYWGINHVRTLHELESLGGIVDNSASIELKIKESYPEADFFRNLEESFDKNYDGYIVATPPSTHLEIAKAIMEKGYPILIEKPMALSSSDAKKIVDLSNEYNVNAMVGHLLLFHPAIIKIKELIDKGKIGKLQYIYSNRLNLGKIRTEENVFWSFAPHDIAILQYFIDSYPIEILSSGGAYVQKEIHDTTITTLSYENNIKAHIYLSWLHPFKEHRLVIIGSNGMLSFEDSSVNKDIVFYDKKFILNGQIPEKRDGIIEKIPYIKAQPLKEELKYFIDNLNINKFEKSDVKNGYEVIKILESASKILNKKHHLDYAKE